MEGSVGNANKLLLFISLTADISAYGQLQRSLRYGNRDKVSFSFALFSAKLTKKNAYQHSREALIISTIHFHFESAILQA